MVEKPPVGLDGYSRRVDLEVDINLSGEKWNIKRDYKK